MPQAFTFPDPVLAIVTLLRAALNASTNPIADDVTVGTLTPEESKVSPSLPYVMVAHDGATISSRVVETATIRVAVWHRSAALGFSLAQLSRALIVANAGDSQIRLATPLAGPTPTNDPDSGAPLSYFSVSVLMRPDATL